MPWAVYTILFFLCSLGKCDPLASLSIEKCTQIVECNWKYFAFSGVFLKAWVASPTAFSVPDWPEPWLRQNLAMPILYLISKFKRQLLNHKYESLMDDIHLLTAHYFRYELRLRGGKIFSSKFGAHEVCIVSCKSPHKRLSHVSVLVYNFQLVYN